MDVADSEAGASDARQPQGGGIDGRGDSGRTKDKAKSIRLRVFNKGTLELLVVHRLLGNLAAFLLYSFVFGRPWLLPLRVSYRDILSFPTTTDFFTTSPLRLASIGAQTLAAATISFTLVCVALYWHHAAMFEPTSRLMEREGFFKKSRRVQGEEDAGHVEMDTQAGGAATA